MSVEIKFNDLTNKELEQHLFDKFIRERKEARRQINKPVPLYFYSKRVYRAYHNAWRLINRKLLTSDEIDIMKQLGCYKPSRVELGTKWYPPMHRVELPVC
jgi:hypothetical protein